LSTLGMLSVFPFRASRLRTRRITYSIRTRTTTGYDRVHATHGRGADRIPIASAP
jgi:hypothetical protein